MLYEFSLIKLHILLNMLKGSASVTIRTIQTICCPNLTSASGVWWPNMIIGRFVGSIC